MTDACITHGEAKNTTLILDPLADANRDGKVAIERLADFNLQQCKCKNLIEAPPAMKARQVIYETI